jgi:hypothetical protein
MIHPKKNKKTKDYDIVPEDYEEDYMVWFW